MKNLFLVSLIVTLTGCQSSQYLVQYNSSPESAMITCGNRQVGYAPANWYYNKEGIKDGILRTQPCKATWMSGAEQYFSNYIDTSRHPKGIAGTVVRPNVPGISDDIQFDYQRKTNDAAARERSDARSQQSFQNAMNSIKNSAPKTTYCYNNGFQVICNEY